MKSTVTLETKDIREIIAKFLGISQEDVIPNRYTFSVSGMTAEQIAEKIKKAGEDPAK